MGRTIRLLVVDDEVNQRELLNDFLSGDYEVETAENGAEALKKVQQSDPGFDAILTDLSMPQMNGVELIRAAKKEFPELGAIIMTAHASLETAIEAIRVGAYDYVLKPVELDDLQRRIEQLVRVNELESQIRQLNKTNQQLLGGGVVVGESQAMQSLLSEAAQVAASDASVLILGETGTGKEVLAQFLHSKSPRSKGPFVPVNCSAIAENLAESEFFGHEKGAFTGADKRTIGFFQQANGGTLFLDELGEMDLRLQPKILRALEERKVQRVGGAKSELVDIRLIGATNRDLSEDVAAGKFREDLLFRINVVTLRIPPLRERLEDIPSLTVHLVDRYAKKLNVKVNQISDDYIQAFCHHQYPGNVRELGNIVERSLIYMRDGVLTPKLLPTEILGRKTIQKMGPPRLVKTDPNKSLSDLVSDFEKQAIQDSLENHDNDIELAAKGLKVSRSTLYSKISKYGIK
jgi:DNA-binding NtrC family response regulator